VLKARWINLSIRRKRHAVNEEAEAWPSLDLPTGQWSQAYFKLHQDLVAEEVLEDSTVVITVTWLEPHAKSPEEWANIPQKSCQKLVSGYTSGYCSHNSVKVFYSFLKMLVLKGLNNFETAEVIKSCIFSWIWGNHLKHLWCFN